MIDKQYARAFAEEFLLKECHSHDPENPTMLDDTQTLERSSGWIFFDDSKKSIATNDLGYAIVGNCPLVIEQEAGRMSFLGTALNLRRF